MLHICTLFDSNYLLRGLSLFRSLQKYTHGLQFYVLCLDDKCFNTLSTINLDNIHPIKIEEIEQWDSRLIEARNNRSHVEYFFTLSPALPLYLLKKNPAIDIITYMDADLFFYQSPEPIYKELGDKSILIIEHRFSEHLKDKEIYGRFNVQYQSFRNNTTGLKCLERWNDQCTEWCYDRLEDGKFADQKYLNEWPELYKDDLVILSHKGGGVAPWNWSKYPFLLKRNQLTVSSDPLIFYHFHAIKILKKCLISHGLTDFGIMPRKYLRWFYRGYINQLKETLSWLESLGINSYHITDKKIHFRAQEQQTKIDFIKEVARKVWSQIMFVC